MSENLHTIVHHVDYFPLRIRVFRNGDMFDQGRILVVTRKQFKHWIVFLDALTTLLRTATAVRRLYTIQGLPVNHFDELETNGEYVALESGQFINVPYGQTRFTMRGKRYNPIIRLPQLAPTFLNSAESMDIYLKKEGYGTITGLPYPFDGILTRSPSASNLQLKHLSSHIPPLKIGGSMEHLNEARTASWLGKNETWLMGERVKSDTKRTEKEEEKKEETVGEAAGKTPDRSKSNTTTKLPRLLNSNRSFKRDRPIAKASVRSDEARVISENLPPIDLKRANSSDQIDAVRPKRDSDTISIKTEEEVISIVKPEKATTESKVSSKVSRKTVPIDDEVRYHRSYQVTETTFVTANSAAEDIDLPVQPEIVEKEKEKEEVIIKPKIEDVKKVEKPSALPERKERAKWNEGKRTERIDRSVEKKKPEVKKKEVVKKEEKTEKEVEVKKEVVRKDQAVGELGQFDVDINVIPKRLELPSGITTGRAISKIVTSRSTMHLFVDDMVGESELEDVVERAQLWDHNRRRQKMRQQMTQTSGIFRSISAPRRRVQLFDPDFD